MGLLVDNAFDVLFNQFTDAGRLRFWQQAKTERFEEIYYACLEILTNLNLDLAEDYWLDLLGKYIGMDRPFEPWPDDNIFTFRETEAGASDPDLSWGDNAGNGGWFQSEYGAVTNTPVSNEVYRRWLKAKAVANVSAGTLADIYDWAYDGSGIQCTVAKTPGQNLVTVTMATAQPQAVLGLIKRHAPIRADAFINVVNS